jgi:hypothetical protein
MPTKLSNSRKRFITAVTIEEDGENWVYSRKKPVFETEELRLILVPMNSWNEADEVTLVKNINISQLIYKLE